MGEPKQKAGTSGQLSSIGDMVDDFRFGEFVADSIGDMVDDFRDKGAIGALNDARHDAVDMVLDGVDSIGDMVEDFRLSEFMANSIGDIVDDFRDKGAIGALKDARDDAVDKVLGGIDAMW